MQPGRVFGDRFVQGNTESGLSVINSCGRDLTSGAAHVLTAVASCAVITFVPGPRGRPTYIFTGVRDGLRSVLAQSAKEDERAEKILAAGSQNTARSPATREAAARAPFLRDGRRGFRTH